MKFTDVLAKILKKNNITQVFGLQGGAVVHIFDSLERCKINVEYTHHESTASFAAASYAKSSRKIGCAVVTTGPGCTNALTGLMGAWQDSVPCIFISGQVRSNHMSYGKKVRQVGTQEVNIIDIVKPITKYACIIKSEKNLIKEFNKSIKIAISGRPGPVWIDIPLEFQWSNVHLKKGDICKVEPKLGPKFKDEKYKSLIRMIKKSENPIFVIGYGAYLSHVEKKVKRFIKKNDFRVVSTWMTSGLFGSLSKYNLGIIGMSGQAGANKAIFNSDLIVCLGCHLAIPHTTTLTESYAPKAKKVFINIDENQLKNLNIKSHLNIHADLRHVIDKLLPLNFNKKKYNKIDTFQRLNFKTNIQNSNYVNSNYFFQKLTKATSTKDALVIDGGGTALYTGFQSASLSENQDIFCSTAISSMGTGLAETVGVFKSKKYRKIYTIIGDGSMLMNIQDLQTIYDLNIPVVIIVVNNNGYLAIRHTQQSFLANRLYGTHPKWKLGIVNFKNAAKAFKIDYIKLNDPKNINSVIKKILIKKRPTICEIITDENQPNLFSQKYRDNKDGTFSPMTLEFMN